MRVSNLIPALVALFLFSFPVSGQSAPQKPEEVLKEFFSSSPSNEKILAVLEDGAVEPYKTELIKKAAAQKPTPEEASRLLAQNPPESYAQGFWKIIESEGTLRNTCYILSSGPPKYQDKALVTAQERASMAEEYVSYIMQKGVPQRFVEPIWEGFLKLNPSKEDFLFAASNARGDFQEKAILYSFSLGQQLTSSEFNSVFELIPVVRERQAKEKEEKLIRTMTNK